MKLTLEQIKSVTVGAVQIDEIDGEFQFAKMTAGQLEAFRAISQNQYNNARATTGIRFDFHTDSTYVKYEAASAGTYELAVDGVLTPQPRIETGETGTYALPEGEHRVTLYLPAHGYPGALRSLELSDGATLTRHAFDRKFLFIGDSITQGWKSDVNNFAYTYLVSDHFNAESIIQGTGSACYNASTIEKLDFDPDTVFVAYGTNDAGGVKTLDEMRERTLAFLSKLKGFYPASRIVVISPLWCLTYNEPRAYGTFADIGKTIRAVARELGMTVIVGEEMIPPLESLFIDAVHPNALGFSLYAHNLIRELSK